MITRSPSHTDFTRNRNLHSAPNTHTSQWRRVLMMLATIRVNGLFAVSAVLFLMCTIGQILLRVSGRDLHDHYPKDSVTMLIAPTTASPREDSSALRTGTRIPTFEERLPFGSTIIESTKIPGGIEVVLANGLCISAREASVTAGGISFKSPYEIKEPMGGTLASKDVGSECLVARDGSFKLIVSPVEITSLSTPLKPEDSESAISCGP